jgi:hypothetical protein
MPASPAEARLKIELQPMRHLWRGIEADLVRLGVNSLEDLKNRDPGELFQAYCALSGKEFDLCVQDSFTSLVEFARTGEPRAWWRFTRERSFPQREKKAQRQAARPDLS